MAEQIIKTRIINKHDIPSNWIKAVNFVPKQGEIIIYDKEDNPDMYSGYSNPFLAPEGYHSIFIGFKFTTTDNTLVFKDKDGKVLLSYENIDNYLELNKFYYISIAQNKTPGVYDGIGPDANKVTFSSSMGDFPFTEYKKIEAQIRTIQTVQKENELKIYYKTIFNETKLKIGDGVTLVNNLPFIESKVSSIIEENNLHTEGYKTHTSVKVYLPLAEDVSNKTITLSDVSQINVGARFSVYYTIDFVTGEFTDIGGSVTAVDKTTNIITLTSAPNFASHNITLPITSAQNVIGCLLIDNGNIGETEPKSDDFISSHAEGSYTKATLASHAEGYMTEALHFAAHAEGRNSRALGYTSHAEGSSTLASGTHSHTEGSLTTASGFVGHAEGANTIASGEVSHAEGNKSKASGSSSHAEGTLTTASGIYSHAEGRETKASNETSHAEGYQTESSGRWSHAEGNNSKAIIESSHAEGSNTNAEGVASHSEGAYSSASGYASHAEGSKTNASGEMSHAEGNKSKATSEGAHAEGVLTTASGYASHAEGRETVAAATYSHASGLGTKTNVEASTVVGKYNNPMAGDLFQVGIGSNDSNRDNGLVVTDNGEVKPKTLVTDFVKLNNQLTIPFSDMNTGKSFLTHKNEIIYSVDNSCIINVGSGAGFNRLVVSKAEFFKGISDITNMISILIGKTVIFKYNGIEYHSSVISIVARSDSNYYNLDITQEEINFGKVTIDKNLIELITFTNEKYKWEEDLVGILGTKPISKEIAPVSDITDLPENVGLKSITFTEEAQGENKDSTFAYSIYCTDGSIITGTCSTNVTNYKVDVSVNKEVFKVDLSYDRSDPYIVGYEYLVPQTVKEYIDSNAQGFPTVMFNEIDNLKERENTGFYKVIDSTPDGSIFECGYLIVNANGPVIFQYYFDGIPNMLAFTEWIAKDRNSTMPLKFRRYDNKAWTNWEYTLTTSYIDYQDNRVANTVKEEKSGQIVSLTDISPITNTIKITASSKNILPYPYNDSTKTENGVTWTIAEDGKITASGTATDYSMLELYNGNLLKKNGYLTFSFDGAINNVGYEIIFYKKNITSASLEKIDTVSKLLTTDDNFITINMDDYSVMDSMKVSLKSNTNNEVSADGYPQIEVGELGTLHSKYIADDEYFNSKVKIYKTKNIFNNYAISAYNLYSTSATGVLKNNYGTTLDKTILSTSADVLTVQQANYPNTTTKTSYTNGFFCIGLNDLIVGETYTLSFNMFPTNDPLNVISSNLTMQSYVNGSKMFYWKKITPFYYSITFTYQLNETYPTRQYIELRLAGLSAKFSHFQLEKSENVSEYIGWLAPITQALDGGKLSYTIDEPSKNIRGLVFLPEKQGLKLTIEYNKDSNSIFSGIGEEILTQSKSYADTKDSKTLASAKSYADTKDSENLTAAKNYTDTNLNGLTNIDGIAFTSGGFYYFDIGTVGSSDAYSYTNKCSCKGLTELVVYTCANNDRSGIVFFDSNGKYITGQNLSQDSVGTSIKRYTVDVPVNAYSFGYSCKIGYEDNSLVCASSLPSIASRMIDTLDEKYTTVNSKIGRISAESFSVKLLSGNERFYDYSFTDILHDSVYTLFSSTGNAAETDKVLFKGQNAVKLDSSASALSCNMQLRYSNDSYRSLIGVQEYDVAVYVENCAAIDSMQFKISTLKDGAVIYATLECDSAKPKKNGWNVIRFTAPVNVSSWEVGTLFMLNITTNTPITFYIGCIEEVKPQKAKIIFVDDHAYKEFMNNAYIPYFKPNNIPVTWGIQPGRLGTVISNTGTLLDSDDITTLANDALSEFSWHSWVGADTATLTSASLREENRKCMSALRKMGILPEHFWRCAWKQNKAENAMSCKDDLSGFAHWDAAAKRQVFPFNDKYKIGRFAIHNYSQTEIDAFFEELKKTHRIYVFYTHSCLEDVSQAGAGSVTPAQAEHFANACAQGIADGWLECVTYNQLCTRYRDIEFN